MNRDINVLKKHMALATQNVTAVDIFACIRELGWNLIFEPMGRVSGSLEISDDGEVTIRVNQDDSEIKQRFTAAHELAHVFLHGRILQHAQNKDKGLISC